MEMVSTMGSGDLGCEIDLSVLIESLRESSSGIVEANFSSPSMVTIRFREDGPAITLYRTGNFQIRGAKRVDEARETKNELLSALRELGVPIESPNWELRTAVFMHDLGHPLGLERLALELGANNTDYEPEQFPGLIYRPETAGITMNIFSSGKVLILGTTSIEIASNALSDFQRLVGSPNRGGSRFNGV